MDIKLSFGEILDKYSILEIKQKKITDLQKLNEITKQINIIGNHSNILNNSIYYYKILLYINEKIWDLKDFVNSNTEDTKISITLMEIHNLNKKRFRVKKRINEINNSYLYEQKNYSETVGTIYIDNEDTIFLKIAEINYLFIEYDKINFKLEDNLIETIKNIFKNTNYVFNEIYEKETIVILKDFNLPEEHLYELFNLKPITYISGGLLGDFIFALSVVCEKYYTTGRKGIIYITDKIGDKFRFGLDTTYNDTYELVTNQKYIHQYKIHNGEKYDINLSQWRKSKLLYKTSWYNLFKTTYNVEWGKHKWIDLPINTNFSNKILISTVPYKPSKSLNYNKIYEKFNNDLLFISQNKSFYEDFTKRFNLNIDFFCPSTLFEFCICINSCKLFCGGLSFPLTIAIACDKYFMFEKINSRDDIHNINIGKKHIETIDKFSINI